jgi:type II secretory pathway component PulJ
MTARSRRGFTLSELTVVVVLKLLLPTAVYTVLITHLRAYTVMNSKVRSQQTVRGGSQALFAELRELSPRGGDLIRIADDSMTVRSSSS